MLRHAPRHLLLVAAVAVAASGCRDVVAAGYRRVADFQGEPYAALYLDRLAAVREAEYAADHAQARDAAVTRETARFLALWMAFDDIVRVAQLKSRASRLQRVTQWTSDWLSTAGSVENCAQVHCLGFSTAPQIRKRHWAASTRGVAP